MARSNRFSKKTIETKDSDKTLSVETFDRLPSFNLIDGEFRQQIYKSDGTTGTIIFNSKKELIVKQFPIAERKGLVVPSWFYGLYQHNANIAIELARVLLKILESKNFHSGITKPFLNISEFILKKQLSALSDLNLSLFDEMINDIEYNRAKALCRDIQYVLAHCPTIQANINSEIQAYIFAHKESTPEEKTFAERLAKANVTNDYSDYVMFQIYAYTSACLSEIEDSYNDTINFLESDRYDSFFYETGAKLYKTLITEGGEDNFAKAFEIELTDNFRINRAVDKLRGTLNDVDKNQFVKFIEASEFKSIIPALPKELKLDPDVIFLCKNVLKQSLGNIVDYKNMFLSRFKSGKNISIQFCYERKLRHWKRTAFRQSQQSFSKWKLQHYFIYRAFYELNQSGKQTGETVQNVLLGRTNMFDFLCQQLLMAISGRNKEVVMSIPARINDINILENEDRFASEKSVELIGLKTRGHHRVAKQPESLSLPINSPMFRYIEILDKVRQIQFPNRTTFFVGDDVYKFWQKKFAINTEIKERNGNLIGTIDSTRFRKVFTGEILHKYLEKISNKDDLIRAVASDLKNSIPLVYLMQSSTAETMIASAIIGLQIKFIEHHLQVAATLKVNEAKSINDAAKRFLCDCIDPRNPDYAENLNIDYCKQFDHCLGCSKAEVYREHLPNIIYRCFQYEQVLLLNKDLYDTAYALKHHLAKQVIETFVTKASDGQQLHEHAFEVASSAWDDPDTYLLPPLLHPNA
ncbi:MAG: hypothetical protein HRU18_22500 [Pseudoalteromonas sp.]|nr:hypothetical protein [Pseudoalteromonas sp.]NRA80985.1 hypothetical protein [Pseudoalteromonas sp.]